ncbi:hypothetical protein Ancab_010220 [Ancistrocladus abbreviatus]
MAGLSAAETHINSHGRNSHWRILVSQGTELFEDSSFVCVITMLKSTEYGLATINQVGAEPNVVLFFDCPVEVMVKLVLSCNQLKAIFCVMPSRKFAVRTCNFPSNIGMWGPPLSFVKEQHRMSMVVNGVKAMEEDDQLRMGLLVASVLVVFFIDGGDAVGDGGRVW